MAARFIFKFRTRNRSQLTCIRETCRIRHLYYIHSFIYDIQLNSARQKLSPHKIDVRQLVSLLYVCDFYRHSLILIFSTSKSNNPKWRNRMKKHLCGVPPVMWVMSSFFVCVYIRRDRTRQCTGPTENSQLDVTFGRWLILFQSNDLLINLHNFIVAVENVPATNTRIWNSERAARDKERGFNYEPVPTSIAPYEKCLSKYRKKKHDQICSACAFFKPLFYVDSVCVAIVFRRTSEDRSWCGRIFIWLRLCDGFFIRCERESARASSSSTHTIKQHSEMTFLFSPIT